MGIDSPALKNHAAEVSCLGACLLDPKAAALVVQALRSHDYTTDQHAQIHRALVAILSRQQAVDLITLATALRAAGMPDAESVASSLFDAVPTAANVRQHITLVKQATIRRQVRGACQRTLQAMEDPGASIPETLANLTEDIESYAGAPGEDRDHITPVKIDVALKTWLQAWDSGTPDLIQSGYQALDSVLGGGFEPGEFIVMGARAGVGKTALALEFIVRAAQAGRGALIISREMRLRKLLNRMLAQVGRMPATALRSGRLLPDDYHRMTHAMGKLHDLPLWLDDRAETMAQVETMVNGWAFTPRLGLVVVDYLQLLRAPREIKERRLQVEHCSAGLKALAMRNGVPVLCLSSLSRVEKTNSDRRPVISDLRESGEIDHDADIVLLLHRGFQQAETEVIIAKARDGGVGVVNLTFRAEYVAFEEGAHG